MTEPLDLRRVRVASPCSEPWSSMQGDERVRFCGRCQRSVYNFAAMTADEVRALLAEREGAVCAQLRRRRDGTLITRDCPVGERRARARGAALLAAAALAFAGAAALAGHGPAGEPRPRFLDAARSMRGLRVLADWVAQPDISSCGGSVEITPALALADLVQGGYTGCGYRP